MVVIELLNPLIRLRKIQYRIEQNFGGKKFWRICDFEMLAEKTLANPRLACILITVRARQL